MPETKEKNDGFIGFKCPRDLVDRLDEEADRMNRNRSDAARILLEENLREREARR
jgi:metal-responsive CopG/Arc/MetJ family transcriptional regulator